MKNIPLFDISHGYINTLKLRTITGAATALAVSLTISSLIAKEPYQRWLFLGSALATTQIGRLASGARVKQDRIIEDITDVSAASRQQVLYKKMTETGNIISPGEAEEEPKESVIVPDVSAAIEDSNHIAVIGPSGSGKTVFTQWLINQCFDNEIPIVYDTDASPRDWGSSTVIGRGGDIGSIQIAMMDDLATLQQRTVKRSKGEDVGGEAVRVVEEFPCLVGDVSDELIRGQESIPLRWLKKLLRRGRKYRMSIVLISQEFEVDSLGIKGEGNLRKAFTIFYLGSTAFSQLDQVRNKDRRSALRTYISGVPRPCLIEVGGKHYVSSVPDLSALAKSLDSPHSSHSPHNPSIALPSAGISTGMREDEKPYRLEDILPIEAQPTPLTPPSAELTISLEETDNSGAIRLGNGEMIATPQARYYHKTIIRFLNEGLSMTRILKDKFGYVGGKYRYGRELWDLLQQRYGTFNYKMRSLNARTK